MTCVEFSMSCKVIRDYTAQTLDVDVTRNDASCLLVNICYCGKSLFDSREATTSGTQGLNIGALANTWVAQDKHLDGCITWTVSQVTRKA